jgi:hypothetical protein
MASDQRDAPVNVHFLHACVLAVRTRSILADKFSGGRTRWRQLGSVTARCFGGRINEAWQQSALNQREYCKAHGIPLKAFGNWRAKFKAEPQPPVRKLLYRRRGLSHTFSHSVSHSLSHMTNDLPGPIVPPARDGHRRTFSQADISSQCRAASGLCDCRQQSGSKRRLGS